MIGKILKIVPVMDAHLTVLSQKSLEIPNHDATSLGIGFCNVLPFINFVFWLFYSCSGVLSWIDIP